MGPTQFVRFHLNQRHQLGVRYGQFVCHDPLKNFNETLSSPPTARIALFLRVVSRTDAAISKLIWIDKGSQRSRRDFRGIFSGCDLQQQSDIRNEATGLHLSELLDEVLAESDEIR